MYEIEYKYNKLTEKTIKEWEDLRTQFKDYPDMVKHINKMLIQLKQIAIPLLIIKKERI